MIAIIDYGAGNLHSVKNALDFLNAESIVTGDSETILNADKVILPGVGAFADASKTMTETGQMEAIRKAIKSGKPFLGICLGEHLLFSEGTEGAEGSVQTSEGLGCIEGLVDKMPEYDSNDLRYKIPHVGWNSIEFDASCGCPLLEGIKPGEYFYFTHSFIAPKSEATVATTTHSIMFPSVVHCGEAVYGVQFHPEKSSDAGAQVLKNFLSIVESTLSR